MPSQESVFAKLYYAVEDAYYSLMSGVNKVLPVYKYFVVPVERSGLPSMVVFILLLLFAGAAGFLFANYGGDLSRGTQELLSGIKLSDNLVLPQVGGQGVSLGFTVEDEKGRPVSGALVSLYLDGELIEHSITEQGEVDFKSVPSKSVSYKVSKEGFQAAEGTVDASKKRLVIVTLGCLVAGCTAKPSAVPSPTFTPTPTRTPTVTPSDALARKTLRVSLFDAQSGQPLLKQATVTVKDAVDLGVLASSQTSTGVADLEGLVVGSKVFVQAVSSGYSLKDSGLLTLSNPLFTNGLQLSLSRTSGQPAATGITVFNSTNSPLVATVRVFEKDTAVPFAIGETSANGSYQINLDNSRQWFVLVNKTGYADYASPNFAGGQSQAVSLSKLVNGTLQYCRVEASAGEVGVGEPVSVTVTYANLSAPPANVTLQCGTNSTQQVVVSTCVNTSGNCTAQCSYSEPGSKAIYAQIGDLNCLSTPVIAVNVTTRGPFCSISLAPQSIQFNGSTTVTVSYSNLTVAPLNNILLVNCGAGGAGNTVPAGNCTGTTGSCTAVCRYSFTPAQVLDNPTRPVFVSYGGAECISDVKFAQTASSLETGVLFNTRYLSNARVALYKVVPNQPQPVFYAAAQAPSGKATFSQLVRGDSFVARASDGSGILSGSASVSLDLPANSNNVSVSLPRGMFNVTALEESSRKTTAALASAGVVFSAFCNAVSDDGHGHTRTYLQRGTCTAVNGSCMLAADAFMSCLVNGSAPLPQGLPGFLDSSGSLLYSVGDANGTLAVERLFSSCGAKNQACCAGSCTGGLVCSSRQVCVDAFAPTENLSLTARAGVVSSSSSEVVFRADPVFAADAIPLTVALGSGCPALQAEISGDAGIVPCFNDLASTPPYFKFDSSASGCSLKSSGLAMPSGEAKLSLSCAGSSTKTTLNLRVVGAYSQDAAQYSPATISTSNSASLFYLTSQKHLEGQLLEVARGVVAPVAAADFQPPTVSIVEPSSGSIVTGPVEIVALAKDDRKLESVSFFLDLSQTPFAVALAAPFAVTWDPSVASVAGGLHTLRVQARDSSGNTASASIVVSKKEQATVVSSVQGLNNLLLGSGGLYYAYSDGVGVASSTCPGGCAYAQWNYAGKPVAPFAALAGSNAYFAYQDASTGESRLAAGALQGTSLVLANLSNALTAPLVFADSSNAYFHKGTGVSKVSVTSVSYLADLPSSPTGFGFDANAVYFSYNTLAGGRIAKKTYSDTSTSFSTLASTSGVLRSLVARDGWVYWLEDSPAKACKTLASGGVLSCASAQLTHPYSLAMDPAGTSLYLLDGSSVKRISTDWSGLVTLATGLPSPKNIAVDSTSVYISVSDSSGASIRKVPKDP